MHPAQFDRKALEQAYLGAVCDNRRLKEKARAHKRNIRTMQKTYRMTKLELELLRAQLESGVTRVDKPWKIGPTEYAVISPAERMAA